MWLWSWSFTTHCMYGDLPIYSWPLCFTLWLIHCTLWKLNPQSVDRRTDLVRLPVQYISDRTLNDYPVDALTSAKLSSTSAFAFVGLYLYIIHAFSVYVGNCGCYGAVWMGCFYVQLMSHWLTEGQVRGLTRHKPVLNPQRCSCCWPFQGGDPFVNLLCVCTALLVPFCVTLFRYMSLFHV